MAEHIDTTDVNPLQPTEGLFDVVESWRESHSGPMDVPGIMAQVALEGETARNEAISLELSEAKEALDHAQIDVLTGAMTRSAFEAIATRIIDRARNNTDMEANSDSLSRPVLLITDIDSLKPVNDNPRGGGHAAGDRYIETTFRAVERAVRPTDYVGRIGGDEGAVLLTGIRPDIDNTVLDYESPVHRRLNSIQLSVTKALGEIPVGRDFNSNGVVSFPEEFAPGVSVGYAIYHPGDTYEQMKARADKMLYDQKQATPM